MNQAPPQEGATTVRATILLSGETGTGVRVAPEVVDELRHGKRPRVHATVNGHTSDTTVAKAVARLRGERA